MINNTDELHRRKVWKLEDLLDVNRCARCARRAHNLHEQDARQCHNTTLYIVQLRSCAGIAMPRLVAAVRPTIA
jgi:hypothetical protein